MALQIYKKQWLTAIAISYLANSLLDFQLRTYEICKSSFKARRLLLLPNWIFSLFQDIPVKPKEPTPSKQNTKGKIVFKCLFQTAIASAYL